MDLVDMKGKGTVSMVLEMKWVDAVSGISLIGIDCLDWFRPNKKYIPVFSIQECAKIQ